MNRDDEALVALEDAEHRRRNGVPTSADVAARERARQLILDVLGPDLHDDELRGSVLGTGWTERFDVRLQRASSRELLLERGWVEVGGLRDRYARSTQLWAAVEGGEVLAAVEVHVDEPPDPVTTVLDRCVERGEVRLREVLELRELRRRGCRFPASSVVLSAAAEVETGLNERLLAPWATGRAVVAPVRLPRSSHAHRVVVACSGVDGSGKSTLVAGLAGHLARSSLPVSRVWLRPGMGLGWLETVARTAKRALRQDPAPGIRAVAANPGAVNELRSRRGVLGWTWSLLVTASFVVGVRRQHAASRGVVLYDRHLLDAWATLDLAYSATDTRLQKLLVRTLLPRAAAVFYLDVPAEVAVSRKPGDVIGESAVRRQLSTYAGQIEALPGVQVLDATAPPDGLAEDAFRHLAAATRPGRRHR